MFLLSHEVLESNYQLQLMSKPVTIKLTQVNNRNRLENQGDSPYNGLYGEAPPERGIFFMASGQYERVGILLVEVYERVAKSVIWVCKRARKGQQMNFIAVKESSL